MQVTPQEAASSERIACRVGRKPFIKQAKPAHFDPEDWDLFSPNDLFAAPVDEPNQIEWSSGQVATWKRFSATNLKNIPRAINGALDNRGAPYILFKEPVAKGTPGSLEATLSIDRHDLPCNGFQSMCTGEYITHHDTSYPKVKLTSGYSTEDYKKFIGDIVEAHLDLAPETLKCEAVSFDGGITSIPLWYNILWPEQNIRIRVTCDKELIEIEDNTTVSRNGEPVFIMYSCWNIKVFN